MAITSPAPLRALVLSDCIYGRTLNIARFAEYGCAPSDIGVITGFDTERAPYPRGVSLRDFPLIVPATRRISPDYSTWVQALDHGSDRTSDYAESTFDLIPAGVSAAEALRAAERILVDAKLPSVLTVRTRFDDERRDKSAKLIAFLAAFVEAEPNPEEALDRLVARLVILKPDVTSDDVRAAVTAFRIHEHYAHNARVNAMLLCRRKDGRRSFSPEFQISDPSHNREDVLSDPRAVQVLYRLAEAGDWVPGSDLTTWVGTGKRAPVDILEMLEEMTSHLKGFVTRIRMEELEWERAPRGKRGKRPHPMTMLVGMLFPKFAYRLDENGRTLLDSLHPDWRDPDLPQRLQEWQHLPYPEATERIGRYLRTVFGKQRRYEDSHSLLETTVQVTAPPLSA